MAGLNPTTREQLRAIAFLRWRLFVNSLRSVRGRLNVVSRGIAALLLVGAGLGGALAIGAASWSLVRDGKLQWLALLFWVIFLFWQLFPVMATAFTQSMDTSELLRFPLSYTEYFLVRLIAGALDIATALGLCWCVGLFVGITLARWQLAPWSALVTAVFIAVNLLLARTVFVWIEHWLSRRHSREFLGVIFLLMIVSTQILGPVLGRSAGHPHREELRTFEKLSPIQRAFPPGMAAASLVDAQQGRVPGAVLWLGASVLYAAAFAFLLDRRLRNQYRGENPSGTGKSPASSRNRSLPHPGWQLPVFASSVSAVFEKELRYFSRSGPMLFTLIMPLVVIFVLWGGRRGFMGNQSGLFFPVGAAYSLLVLNNIIYNSFGADGSGIQFFFLSPVSFRQIALAKNLAHFTVLALDVALLWLGIHFVYQSPPFRVFALTVAWCLFAVPLNFAVGNLLSVYSPKRVDFAMFGRQRASEATILVSLVVQATGVAIGAVAILIGHHFSSLWIATMALLVLSIFSIAGYCILLGRIDQIALRRREVLATELCRA